MYTPEHDHPRLILVTDDAFKVEGAPNRKRTWGLPPIAAVRPFVCVLLQLVMLVSACSSWQVQTAAVPDVITQNHSRKIRVTRADQSRVVLENPEIRNDTLFGGPGRLSADGTPSPTQEVALADITQVAVRRTDDTKTAFLVLGSLAVAAGAVAAIAAAIASSTAD